MFTAVESILQETFIWVHHDDSVVAEKGQVIEADDQGPYSIVGAYELGTHNRVIFAILNHLASAAMDDKVE